MASDLDLVKLYSGNILALAADIPHLGRLDPPCVSVRRRAPLCGSTVTVDLRSEGGRIVDFAQDVKACALGQAAASVLGAHVIGRSREEIRIARDQLAAMLRESGPVPEAPFDGLEVLLPAREFTNRHASILLAFDATLEAMTQAEAAA
ncbi:iron-sulfur cluster assembly scaffold protein [Tropicimonas sp. IMCC6043]|uniref:iron-sulfur cluster assembly scaffold protein n=1 Tax=Tropicimonas sp. IMCC6043 TaxID=2510645 RepID=UPI00101C0A80|nr:iron-sulfur cluster assembly scaffold protein [Tropicimonas sp. IMCC6043]RYH12077.1 iron-sulfur cluster assembly scaffold protein [Tropicimonas sp. IMCC6043]